MPVRVRLQHTRYPHIGARSGYAQLGRYLDPARFEVDVHGAADSDADLPFVPGALRRPLRYLLQRRGMRWYKLSDLAAELGALWHGLGGRYDLVHFLDGEHAPQYLPGALRRTRARVKTVATYHQPASMLPRLIRRDVVAQLDHVILVASSQLEFFAGLLPADRIHVILHGVDTDFFHPQSTRAPDRRLRCITTGHWLRDWATFRTVAAALRADDRIAFEVVSSDAAAVAGSANVLVHQSVDDEALAKLYRSADVLFLPLTEATANNTLLEGMASGLPVVASQLSGVRSYLPDEAGLLVEGNLVEGFVAALRRLRADVDLRVAMGRTARARAEQLSWPKVAQRHGQLYERVVGAGAAAESVARRRARLASDDLISVVIPAYNAARTLPQTLASVLAQTHTALEVLVVDDGSTDATGDTVAGVSRIDPRVRLLPQLRAGVAAARNHGIEAARGAFLAVLDADDLWHPEKLAKQLARLHGAGPEAALVSCFKCKIDGEGRLLRVRPSAAERRQPTFRALLHANFICASAPLMRTALVRAVGGYDSSLRARGGEGAEDLKLYLELASGYRLEVVPEVLVAYRVGIASMSRRLDQMRRSHHLVLDDIRARIPDAPEAWFVRGRCRADLDAATRLATAGRWGEVWALVAGLVRRYPCRAACEIMSWHGLSFPGRIGALTARRFNGDVLDWGFASTSPVPRAREPG
jgi:glycosyltransferase involved in cell wall biosynthesis